MFVYFPQDVAERNNVTAMPTFQFFKGKVKVDEMTGADEKKLEEKIKKWIGDNDSDVGVKGHVSNIAWMGKAKVGPWIARTSESQPMTG